MFSSKPVPEALKDLGEIYEKRNAIYGSDYRKIGYSLLSSLGPVTLNSVDDFNRFSLLVQLFGKLGRYAAQFKEGGHADSLDDLSVYAQMLREVDSDIAEETKAMDEHIATIFGGPESDEPEIVEEYWEAPERPDFGGITNAEVEALAEERKENEKWQKRSDELLSQVDEQGRTPSDFGYGGVPF